MLWACCVSVCIVHSESLCPHQLKAAVISIMRTVIRVIDTAAVITGTVTQYNCKEEGGGVPLDTQTHIDQRLRKSFLS